jgi:hypothetical protein
MEVSLASKNGEIALGGRKKKRKPERTHEMRRERTVLTKNPPAIKEARQELHATGANAPAGVALVPDELVLFAGVFAVVVLNFDVDELWVDALVELREMVVVGEADSVVVAGSGSLAEDRLAAAMLAAEVVAAVVLLRFFFLFFRAKVQRDDVLVGASLCRSARLLGRRDGVGVGVGVGVGCEIGSGVSGSASGTSRVLEKRCSMVVVGVTIIRRGGHGLALAGDRVVVRRGSSRLARTCRLVGT